MEEAPTKSLKAVCALQAINQPTDIKLRSELTDDDPRFTYHGATHPNRRPLCRSTSAMPNQDTSANPRWLLPQPDCSASASSLLRSAARSQPSLQRATTRR